MSVVIESHIVIDENGSAKIAGTGYLVRLLAQEHKYRGYTAERLREAHPDLSLGQLYSALAYYYDHQGEIDADLERRRVEVERLRSEAGEPHIVKRLKAEGRWPYPFTVSEAQIRAEDALDKHLP